MPWRARQWRNVELAGGIEAAVGLGHLLAQQAVGSDQLAIVQHDRIAGRPGCRPDHHQVIADRIESVGIATAGRCFCSGLRMQLLIENAVAQMLAGVDLRGTPGHAQDQVGALHLDIRTGGQIRHSLATCLP